GPCLSFPQQADFHPGHYLAGLANAAIRKGVRIFTGAQAKHVAEKTVITEDGIQIHSLAIVVATNVPFNERAIIHSKQAAYRTYVIAADYEPAPEGYPCLIWDTAEP